MSFENQLEELEKKSNLILEKFGYIIQRQDELEKVNKEILERMTTLSVDLAETLVSIIDNAVKDSIIEKIIEAELRLERIVLDRTRSDEVR